MRVVCCAALLLVTVVAVVVRAQTQTEVGVDEDATVTQHIDIYLPTQAPVDHFPTQIDHFPTQIDNFPTQAPVDNIPTQLDPTQIDNFPTQAPVDDFPTQAPIDEITTQAPFDDITTQAPFDHITTQAPYDGIPLDPTQAPIDNPEEAITTQFPYEHTQYPYYNDPEEPEHMQPVGNIVVGINVALAGTPAPYNRAAVVNYARTWWNSNNHDSSGYDSSCTPWSYQGNVGDSANFVSQCILAGGHADLVRSPCRGYPCGREEVGAANLGSCLMNPYGWRGNCGYKMAPPTNIRPGDAIVFFTDGCWSGSAHAGVVTKVEAGVAYITAHTNNRLDLAYTFFNSHGMPYNLWLHYPDDVAKKIEVV